MEDSKKKQIKFEPEYSSEFSAEDQQAGHLSHHSLRTEEKNTRQTTLDEFFYTARGGAKYRNVH